MTIFDYAVFVIVGLSVIVSLMRGLIGEVLSIAGWIAALYVAKTYAVQLIPLLPDSISGQGLRVLIAFLVLFVVTLLLSGLVSKILSSVFSKVGLGWINNILGAVFGFGRGLLIVSVVVFLAGLTKIPQDDRWKNAMFSATFEAFVIQALDYAPNYLKKQIDFD